jgi:hypothetical protein
MLETSISIAVLILTGWLVWLDRNDRNLKWRIALAVLLLSGVGLWCQITGQLKAAIAGNGVLSNAQEDRVIEQLRAAGIGDKNAPAWVNFRINWGNAKAVTLASNLQRVFWAIDWPGAIEMTGGGWGETPPDKGTMIFVGPNTKNRVAIETLVRVLKSEGVDVCLKTDGEMLRTDEFLVSVGTVE